MDKRKNMKQLNENIFHQYNKWKTGYVRKENSIQMRLDNFLSNDRNSCSCYISEDGKHVDCDTDIYIFDEDLINGKFPFPFGKIHGDFNCDGCAELISLEGAPEEVEGNFACSTCPNLTSLEGAPQIVNRGFSCNNCPKLTSLEGAPKEVGGSFYTQTCPNLTSLIGAPEKVGRSFYTNNCSNLISLEGAPKKVGRVFACTRCKSLTSLEYVPKEIDRELVVDKRFEGQIPSDIKILKIRYTE